MTVQRLVQPGAYYEAGVALEFAYTTVAAPRANLRFMRGPVYGGSREVIRMAQSVQESPTGRPSATIIASQEVRSLEYTWPVMPEGFPQAQRIKGVAKLHGTSPVATVGSTEYRIQLGFRSFNGVAPTRLDCEELNSVGSVIATHAFTVAVQDLVAYPQGSLHRLEQTFTTLSSCANFRIVAESSGTPDFAVTDIHAFSGTGVDLYANPAWNDYNDADGDGVADDWSLASGSASNCEHYGMDAAGLAQWIRLISKGAGNVFQVKRAGGGEVQNVKLVEPTQDAGWLREAVAIVRDIRVKLVIEP